VGRLGGGGRTGAASSGRSGHAWDGSVTEDVERGQFRQVVPHEGRPGNGERTGGAGSGRSGRTRDGSVTADVQRSPIPVERREQGSPPQAIRPTRTRLTTTDRRPRPRKRARHDRRAINAAAAGSPGPNGRATSTAKVWQDQAKVAGPTVRTNWGTRPRPGLTRHRSQGRKNGHPLRPDLHQQKAQPTCLGVTACGYEATPAGGESGGRREGPALGGRAGPVFPREVCKST